MDIQVNHISKVYGTEENKVTALDDAVMEIREGDFISIMGPSGSGKTTILRSAKAKDWFYLPAVPSASGTVRL